MNSFSVIEPPALQVRIFTQLATMGCGSVVVPGFRRSADAAWQAELHPTVKELTASGGSVARDGGDYQSDSGCVTVEV